MIIEVVSVLFSIVTMCCIKHSDSIVSMCLGSNNNMYNDESISERCNYLSVTFI